MISVLSAAGVGVTLATAVGLAVKLGAGLGEALGVRVVVELGLEVAPAVGEVAVLLAAGSCSVAVDVTGAAGVPVAEALTAAPAVSVTLGVAADDDGVAGTCVGAPVVTVNVA